MRRLACGFVLAVALAAGLLAAAGAQAQEPEYEVVAPAVRDVTPPGFTPGPSIDGPLVREKVPPPPPGAPRWRRFTLPATRDAGTFVTRERELGIAGVVALARDATCELADGTAWPCGHVALDSLRRFLLGRPVECFYGTYEHSEPLSVACRVGRTDIGLWLLSQGWAMPAQNASDAYRKASEDARCGRRGLWRGGSPSDCG